MTTVTTDKPTTARWVNTGGDVRIHIVPTGTPLLVDPAQDGETDPWSLQVTTPICGLGVFHGPWVYVPKQVAPLTLCSGCFPTQDA